ncbi:ROK family protein [Curtobacterium sp. Leaf261]|uniref:ROK family protein n=1 Tax=Curtobacterium sp. Leaf261 TaxID=1736311 RepID=UPI0006FB55D4|nr:ROK family protein [Curtobacterium sp. Leaf261]KQO64755.1 hypothetical protein ASF23_00705 [Curtobacterium sp. Leaf261]
MTDEQAMPPVPTPRRSSAAALLDHAFATGPFTASEAIVATGLTRSTVLAACDELVRLGWIRELDDTRTAGEYQKGRPARRYALDEHAGHVLGVDVGQHRVTAVLATLRGTITARCRRSLGEAGEDPAARLRVTAETVDAVLADASVDPERIFVTAIGVPAPVDAAGRSPVGDDGYWAHMNPGFPDALRSHGVVLVENDANLAAVAERSIGHGAGASSFAALLSGERFGAGLIVDGALLRGAHGGAGEMRVLDLVGGAGSTDGIAALARRWGIEAIRTTGVGRTTSLSAIGADALTAADVLGAAAAGDRVAGRIVERLGDRLARVCLVLGSLLDIERVVVAGAIAEAAGPVIARARAILDADHYAPVPEIVASDLGADIVVVGAVARALDAVRTEPLAYAPAVVTVGV